MVDTRNMVDSRQSLFGRIAQGRAVQTRVRALKEFGLTRPASVCVQVQQLEEANKRLMHVNLALTSLVARRARSQPSGHAQNTAQAPTGPRLTLRYVTHRLQELRWRPLCRTDRISHGIRAFLFFRNSRGT